MPDPMKPRPVWFLPRTRDRPVVSAMSLGDIISSPWEPEEALNTDKPPTIPSQLLRLRPEEEAWHWKKGRQRKYGGGLFASFLQMVFGISGDAEATREDSHTDIYDAERLVTTEFVPDKAYLELALQDDGAQDFFLDSGITIKAFMVTGLKIAYGATKATEMMAKKGMHAQLGFNGTPLDVPLEVGPKIDFSVQDEEELSAGKSDFVFGFKLRTITYKKGRLAQKKYDRGAQYGVGGDADDDEEVEEHISFEDVTFDEIEEDGAELFGMQSQNVVSAEDEGEEVRCFHPEKNSC